VPTETIRVAETPEDQQAFGSMVREYIDWVRERWSDKGAQIDAFFSHQGIEERSPILHPRTPCPMAWPSLPTRV
jgi:hypothetical protein